MKKYKGIYVIRIPYIFRNLSDYNFWVVIEDVGIFQISGEKFEEFVMREGKKAEYVEGEKR